MNIAILNPFETFLEFKEFSKEPTTGTYKCQTKYFKYEICTLHGYIRILVNDDLRKYPKLAGFSGGFTFRYRFTGNCQMNAVSAFNGLVAMYSNLQYTLKLDSSKYTLNNFLIYVLKEVEIILYKYFSCNNKIVFFDVSRLLMSSHLNELGKTFPILHKHNYRSTNGSDMEMFMINLSTLHNHKFDAWFPDIINDVTNPKPKKSILFKEGKLITTRVDHTCAYCKKTIMSGTTSYRNKIQNIAAYKYAHVQCQPKINPEAIPF